MNRVKECNGSITETVVPGSTTYFSQYCYRYNNWPCGQAFITPWCYYF